MSVFGWLNDQLLRMTWLNDLVGAAVAAIGLDPASRIGGSVQFFVYDVIKIFILLSVLIFAISYVQSHFPPERTRAILGGRSGLGANTLAALLGTLTPFCSCSSIPLFIGFTAAGLPLAVTFSFLISSPLVDLASVILLASIFSWPIALAYVVVGLVVAIVGGTIIGRLGMEGQVAEFVRTVPVSGEAVTMTRGERVTYARDQVMEIVHRVWPYVLIGVGIGAAIHNWVPADVISALWGRTSGGRFPWRFSWASRCMPTSSAPCRLPRRWSARGGPWHGAGLHDGGDRPVAAVAHHAETCGEDAASGYLHRRRDPWHPVHRAELQRDFQLVHLRKDRIMIIKILGSGCKKCVALGENAKAAAAAAGKQAEIVKVTDFAEIAAYGVMSTPGLVVDEKVVSTGKVLTVEEIGRFI